MAKVLNIHVILVACALIWCRWQISVRAVALSRYNLLTKDEFLVLDREVTDFYYTKYEQLDARNVTYDEQLFKALRAYRHTIVMNQFDYKYTSTHLMEQAQGSRADKKLCIRQLEALVNMANTSVGSPEHYGTVEGIPISAINFFESYGRAEAGLLNGNSVWWGSHSTCIRAKIPAQSSGKYWPNGQASDIKGHYCVAHLRSKLWPKRDIYFDDRISVRVGICLPDTCHSLAYHRSESVQRSVDYLARSSLGPPFNGNRFYIDNLYCLPSEDSPFRQWNFGAKLFIVFTVVWILLLIYTNRRYEQRKRASRKLGESEGNATTLKQTPHKLDSHTNEASKNPQDSLLGHETSKAGDVNGDNSNAQIASITSVERNLQASDGIDLVAAFSIESNLAYLFKTRSNEFDAKNASVCANAPISEPQQEHTRSSQQHHGTNRRFSNFNLAPINDLQVEDESEPKSTEHEAAKPHLGPRSVPEKRVNLDIFDGIKVFATTYIILGHTMMFFFGNVSDIRFGDERMLDTTMIVLVNTLQVVGLFYIITGILLTYFAFSRHKLKQLLRPTFWLLVVASRYLRLFPTYFLVFWFAKHVAPYTGEGAFWLDYRTDAEHARGFCATESWTTMLTMSAADVKVPMGCVPQAWYLSNDFRTLLIMPFYIMLLVLNQKAGYAAIVATFALSSLKLVKILGDANIDYSVLLHWQPHIYALLADRLHDVYTDLTVRMSTYLLGVVVGHLLYLYETRQIESWPRWFRNYGLKLAILLGAITFMGVPLLANPYVNQFLPRANEVDSDLAVVVIPLLKSLMEICISVLLLLMATGSGFKWINDLLSCRIAKVLANISYAVFMVHVEVMYKLPALKAESTYWYLFLFATFFIGTSNLVAFFIYLLYEMPINNTIRCIMKRAYYAVVK